MHGRRILPVAVLALLMMTSVLRATSWAQPVEPQVGPPAAGCSKDTDCKGDRICDEGTCTSVATAPVVVPAPTCAKDTDCLGNLVCTSGACASVTFAAQPTSSGAPPTRPASPMIAPPPDWEPPRAPVAPTTTSRSLAPSESPRSGAGYPPAFVRDVPRRSGYAASASALVGLQLWDASGSPGGYPLAEASGATYAFIEASSIGAYISHSESTDYSVALVEHYNRDGDGARYGMLGLGVRGKGRTSAWSYQPALGLSWTQFPDGEGRIGLGTALDLLMATRSGWGVSMDTELDLERDSSAQNIVTFTVGIGIGLER